MSGSLVLAEQAVQPAWLYIPDDWDPADPDQTAGDEVISLCEQASFGPDPEQRLCLNAIFAKRRTPYGVKSVAFEVNLLAARQNLKTAVEMQAVLGWLFLEDHDPVVWTGQEWKVISQHFHKLDEIIAGYSWMARKVRSVHRGERDQSFELKSGAQLLFRTREPDGGAGLTAPKIVMDETWKVNDSHISGLLPTMSALSITGDPQIVYGSSAAHEESDVLRDLTQRGRAACQDEAVARRERRLIHVEFCAPPPEVACDQGAKCDHSRDRAAGCGMDKPKYWRLANPAMGRRISEDHIAGERRTMTPQVFGRERMGWHDPGKDEDLVMGLVEWAGALDPASEPWSRVGLAVVFTSNRAMAAVGLCGRRSDGFLHVEVANYQAGTSWVVPWLVTRWLNEDDNPHYPPVAIAVDQNAFEKTIIDDLENAGIPVMKLATTDVAMAYGEFIDALTDRRVLKHRGQDDLDLALAGASPRDIGDAGRAWGRRKSRDPKQGSGVEIACLVAVTNALYAFLQNDPEFESDEPGVWAL